MKKEKERAYDKCCFYCEHSTVDQENDTVYCNKKKKNVSPEQACHAFFYDLLRRTPTLPKLPEVALPTLD